MKKVYLLVGQLFIYCLSFGQFAPGDLNWILEPIKPPLEMPEHGLMAFANISDSSLFQVADGENWNDSNLFVFNRNQNRDFTKLQLSNNIGGTMVSFADFTMSYKYQTGESKVYRRIMENDVLRLINNYQINRGGRDNRVLSVNFRDSSFIKTVSFWIVSPGKEDYTYTNDLLTERIRKTTPTGGSSMENEQKWNYSYDANDNCIEVLVYDWDENDAKWVMADKHSYEYNADQKMDHYTYEFHNGTSWELDNDEMFFYYDNGVHHRTEEIGHGQDEGDDDATDFSFNSDGNISSFINEKKNAGTWEKFTNTIIDYSVSGEATIGHVYAWTGSAWAKDAHQRIVFRKGVKPAKAPAAPSNLTISPGKRASQKFSLNWNDNSDNEDGFVIYRGENSGDLKAHDTVAMDETSFLDTGLCESCHFYYEVSAYNSTGESEKSNQVDAETGDGSSLGEYQKAILAFPNPANGEITIRSYSPILSVEVFDFQGRVILQKKIENETQIVLSLEGMDPGNYVLKSTTNEGQNIIRLNKM